MLTPTEIHEEMKQLSGRLDDGIEALKRYVREYAQTENDYRLARATTYLAADGPVAERNAIADSKTGKERYAMRLADGMRQAALEAVRSRRQQLSALQSVSAAYRAEAEFARTGPREGP